MAKKKWTTETLRLQDGHGWTCKPGHRIFVLDAGAVRFDVPERWVPVPQEKSCQLYNARPPDDDCRLEASVMYLHPRIDWSELRIETLVAEVVRPTFKEARTFGEVTHLRRPDLELAWIEARYLDGPERRAARTRTGLARRGTIQALITMDFWDDDAARFTPVWDEVLRSLQLGQFVKDPTHRKLN
jgi:hypothetical protein